MDEVSHEDGTTHQKKGGVLNTLYPPGPRPGAGPRVKNHCRKFWWCDCLILIIIVLVIVLPIIFVAIPKKAQRDINASTLEVNSLDLSRPTENGFHLKILGTAKSSSSFHPTLDGFRAAFYLEGKEPFFYADVPETKAEAETQITIDQDVQIANMEAFKEYNKVVIGTESFDLLFSGKTKVHQSGLRAISVDYNKRVTMKGLNKLKGLNITNMKILSGLNEKLPDGSNMIGNVLITNPGVMTIDLGNVTMNLAIDGTGIGYSFIPNMVLKPGFNNISMQSTVEQIAVFQLVNSKYKNAVLPVDIVGNSSISNGQHLSYFEESIKSNTVRVDLDVGPALAAIGVYNATKSA
ncbi:hypothetical protein CC80DRAFT_429175 [Byssothecium circinans]|uniref:DUF3712 domain-containing protein n=1 Tax=Byssothecium circinans TaxID=147558 RepID=A0A6A5TAZ9_9PLEO|nr:hypothetical protein CC80DRAFT_429175 [Byssothecium circinans]